MRSLTSLIAPSLIALAAAAPGAAQAQTQGLELYDLPNFQGAPVAVTREISNLGPGAFDDMTTSIRVLGGAWEVCERAFFQGRCQTVTQDVWDLERVGLNNAISSIRPAGGAGTGTGTGTGTGAYPGPVPYGQPSLTLYESANYGGRSVSFTGRADNLRFQGFEDRARSARVTGEWTLCEGLNLSGRCERVGADIPDLSRIAMAGTISSFAPAQTGGTPPPYPGPGTPGAPYPGQPAAQSLTGVQAGFFPYPYIPAGRGLTACLRGDARSCEAEADAFCRGQQGGWREGAYYSLDYRGGMLNDVLCVR